MKNSIFSFKHFSLEQSGAPQKIGTDAVLLGAWVSLDGSEREILDVGTGTGVIAMQLAFRSSNAFVTGIDISAEAIACASKNFASSAFSQRMYAECVSYQDFMSKKRYDLIVSNPPYFPCSTPSNKHHREISRNNDFLPFDSLDSRTRELLSENGRFALILPVREYSLFLSKTLMFPIRECFVSSLEGHLPIRVMAEFSMQAHVRYPSQQLSIHDTDGNYTEAYRNLTKDFYLAF
ncbi:MAG: methyltransferase [Alistipes sp.]|nr:methyltransferase [Candidatus Alistipes equi]